MDTRAEVASLLVEWSRACAAAGWTRATSGNFSAVVEEAPRRLLISRSGVDKSRLTPEDFVVVDESGRMVEGRGAPSAETHVHLAVVRRFGAGAVGHTHSPRATIVSERLGDHGGVSFEGLEMLKALDGVRTHDVRLTLPIIANTQDWAADARASVEAVPQGPPHGFLIRGHGLYAWGRDVSEARRHLDALEFLLEVGAAPVSYSK